MSNYIEINNLGSFASIAALWAAHPEGGTEGDYCTINGVKYHWNKYDRMWMVDPNYGPTPAREVETFDGDVNIQNNLTVAGYIRAKGIKQPCLGLFLTYDALTARWPEPEVGAWALVGDELPAELYVYDATDGWKDTGNTVSIDEIEFEVANAVAGWVPISDISQLPADPTPEQQAKAYLLGTTLYVYDSENEVYVSAQLKGDKGDKGDQGNSGYSGAVGELEVVNNLKDGGEEKALSAEMGKDIGAILNDTHSTVSPNTAIGSQSTSYPTTKVLANNLTTTDWVEGINIVLRSSTTLVVGIYDVSKKYMVRELENDSYEAGTHSITFDEPFKLGANQFVAVKTTQLNTATSGGVGYYLDGVLTEGKEASYELKTLKKKLQSKVSDLEDVTENLPAIEDDVLGTSGKYVSPITPLESFTNNMTLTNSYANRLFTDKKIKGVRVFCYQAGTIDIGIYNREKGTLTSIKQTSTVQEFNTILFDNPFFLKPSELIAAKGDPTTCLKFMSSGDLGYYNAGTGEYTSGRAISLELIVEDDGLVGDVSKLNKLTANGSWCSVGTSITHANNNISTSTLLLRGYQDRVRDKIAFTAFTNVGVAGQAIATGAKSGPVGCLAAQVDTVLTTVADYYTIEHGINDWNRCATVGTIDDFINNTGYNTFYGAWRIVIDKIYTLNPSAKIILITPRKAYGASVFPSNWWDANTYNDTDYYLKDYVAAVKAIGEFLSLPVCDWFAESNTNQYNLAADSVDVALHPNDTGYQKLANLLVQTFKKVIG